MEHAFYWVSTLLQLIMIFILGGIHENTKKKENPKISKLVEELNEMGFDKTLRKVKNK